MFSSNKSPIVKIVGYALLGLFVLVIVIAFGMPEFTPMGGRDAHALAKVNGKTLYTQDFLRYKNFMYGNMSPNVSMITAFIVDRLLFEEAVKLGFEPTNKLLRAQIRNMEEFRDHTGAYNPAALDMMLRQSNLTHTEFYKLMKDYTTTNQLREIINQSVAVPNNEIKALFAASNTKITLAYSLLTSNNIRQRYAADLVVTDKEVEEHMKSDRKERQDPQTDKERVKANLERTKYLEMEDKIIAQTNDLVKNNANFNTVSRTLRGTNGTSHPFGLGEPVIDNSRNAIPLAFTTSKIFTDNFLKMKVGESSEAIKTPEGIYVFTVTKKETNKRLTDEQAFENHETLYDETSRAVSGAINLKLMQDANIKRYFEAQQ